MYIRMYNRFLCKDFLWKTRVLFKDKLYYRNTNIRISPDYVVVTVHEKESV